MLDDALQISASSAPAHLPATPMVPVSSRELRLQAVQSKLPELRAITLQIFPGKVETAVEEDPEIDDYRMLVFNVEAHGGFKETHGLQLEWYKRTAELLGNDVNLIVLSIHHIP
jgi:hypothetical protein